MKNRLAESPRPRLISSIPRRRAARRSRPRDRTCDAGVVAVDLGAHALRHSHATKQVEMATPPKVVSDILGHRSTASLTTYARVARERLRSVSLPPPRK